MTFLQALLRYIQDRHAKDYLYPLPNLSDWTLTIDDPATPRQGNGCDCGVFCCMFAEFLCGRRTFEFTQDDARHQRRSMRETIMKLASVDRTYNLLLTMNTTVDYCFIVFQLDISYKEPLQRTGTQRDTVFQYRTMLNGQWCNVIVTALLCYFPSVSESCHFQIKRSFGRARCFKTPVFQKLHLSLS